MWQKKSRPQIICIKCHNISFSKSRLIKYLYLLCKHCEFHTAVVSVMWSCSSWGYCRKQTTVYQRLSPPQSKPSIQLLSFYAPELLEVYARFGFDGLCLTLWSTGLALFNPSLSYVVHAFKTLIWYVDHTRIIASLALFQKRRLVNLSLLQRQFPSYEYPSRTIHQLLFPLPHT